MIRSYHHSDLEAVLNLFRLNCPAAFAESELEDFTDYLENHLKYYFVVEAEGKILACGGINSTEDRQHVKISWDMVHPAHHGLGLGQQLLGHRLNFIREELAARQVTVRTSQIAYRFYEKSGFVLQEIVPDYWAPGFDLYRMELFLPG